VRADPVLAHTPPICLSAAPPTRAPSTAGTSPSINTAMTAMTRTSGSFRGRAGGRYPGRGHAGRVGRLPTRMLEAGGGVTCLSVTVSEN
jgi:hypothetical protein